MSGATTTALQKPPPLGAALPPCVAHAISVSLPAWKDNVGYMVGEERVLNAIASGYPRFTIHFSVKTLARICEQKFGASGERCLLYPTKRTADHCRAFLVDRSSQSGSPVKVRLIQYPICLGDKQKHKVDATGCDCGPAPSPSRFAELHIVLFPADALSLAKECWQHTGMGISSRYAEYCLSLIPEESVQPPSSIVSHPEKGHNEHYLENCLVDCVGRNMSSSQPICSTGDLGYDMRNYLEECHGYAVLTGSGAVAKRALRRRIADALARNVPEDIRTAQYATDQAVEIGPKSRGAKDVTEDDVFLFPTGMCAIWNAYDLLTMTRPAAKTICFGFTYMDTLKLLQKWGPGSHFLGHGLDADIDELENILEEEKSTFPSKPPALALFTEFPSNPLLRAADLPRLRALADKYDFPIIIDETVGNFLNVSVFPYADIVVSSTSKIFSGGANVTGGSLVLNPAGRHYQELKTCLVSSYEDIYFEEDAICMELNSRDFERRIRVVNENAEAVCDFLHSRSVAGGVPSSVIKDILYPKWTTRDKYDHCRAKDGGGFGGLFSITFTTAAASTTFFDNLSCYKGGTFGTNFTLACPYTVIAHYSELEWVAEYGLEETLVRVNVGMEAKVDIVRCIEVALKAAQATSTST